MRRSQLDLSIFNKFEFQRQPVGIKFLFKKPSDLKVLNKKLAFCEMFVEAQQGEPFYTTKENHECAGTFPLGMEDIEPVFASGLIGEKLGVFEDARTGKRPYFVLPRLEKGTVNYVAFSPLDKLTFNPDILIITADIKQAEIILRASSYRTGRIWNSKTTAVLGCAWLYIYPYISGEINHLVTGICSGGMTARGILPDGLVLISIPFDQIPSIVENLESMPWVPQEYKIGRDGANEYFHKVVDEINQE
jgi:uncharacterized protein (DUF169 family)